MEILISKLTQIIWKTLNQMIYLYEQNINVMKIPNSISCLLIGLFFLLITSCTPAPNPSDPAVTDSFIQNIAFDTVSDFQKMDVYLPKGRTSETPVVVLIHGGAWSGGDKTDMNIIITKIQKEWPEAAIVNINYRLANGSSIIHTQISEDLRKAVLFIAAHKEEWKISNKMAMVGASAGAHLALLYAYKLDDENYVKAVSDIFGPAYFADYSYYESFNIFLGGWVKDVMKKYAGSYWDESLYQSLSPYHIVNASNYVPTIIFHGTADLIVPLYQSQYFKTRLDDLGLDAAYYEYAGEGHGFSDAKYNDCVQKTVSFFKEKM